MCEQTHSTQVNSIQQIPTNNMIKSKLPEYPCFRICATLTETGLSKRTKRTPQQDSKLNNAAQDDEQHNAALERRNHEKKHKRKSLIYVKISYLN
jgi:hypothetical protein